MATLHITVGVPGSGKSTFARRGPWQVLSADRIRTELCGDAGDQTRNSEVFAELHRRARRLLAEGVDVLVDATNVEVRARRELARIADDTGAARVAWRMATPHATSRARNRARAGTDRVPEGPMGDLIDQFDRSCSTERLRAEGWQVHTSDGASGALGDDAAPGR